MVLTTITLFLRSNMDCIWRRGTNCHKFAISCMPSDTRKDSHSPPISNDAQRTFEIVAIHDHTKTYTFNNTLPQQTRNMEANAKQICPTGFFRQYTQTKALFWNICLYFFHLLPSPISYYKKSDSNTLIRFQSHNIIASFWMSFFLSFNWTVLYKYIYIYIYNILKLFYLILEVNLNYVNKNKCYAITI